MSDNASSPLHGRTIAVPETREAELFATMLERRGAKVVRCPMVSILDAPDPQPVLHWAGEVAADVCSDVVLLTGEGLRRILGCIERHAPARREPFVQGLGRARKITRGPKPARALRDIGLRPDLAAEIPTTEGVVRALGTLDLRGRCVGVQLYGTDPNRVLVDFLERSGATVRTVAPYVYADAADDSAVQQLLQQLRGGAIDAVAFTSTPQVERLFAAAPEHEVRSALQRTIVAAVGPVVAETLRRHRVEARVMPDDSFFLKPLTSVLEEAFAEQH